MHARTSKNFVDSHFHVFAAGGAKPGARYVPAYAAPLAAWRDVALPLGVTRGVLVQTSFLGTDNRQLLAELRADPQNLRGVAVVAPDTPLAQLQELDVAGVRGVRLNLAGAPAGMQAWTCATGFWDGLIALGWHVELHTDIGALPAVIAQVPQAVAVVIDHMAKPQADAAQDPTVAAVTARARRGPVYIKLSGHYRLGGLDAGSLARRWVGELGAGAMLWGSDWPCTNHETCADYPTLLGALEGWVGPEAALAALVRNPARLYWASGD